MISFVTLFARDIECTADVYRLLGFEFVQEQHGSGPRHLAAVNKGMVLEIYPGDDAVSPGTMFGVDVADLEDIRAKLLTAKVPVRRDIDSVPGMRRMIVTDPEMRQIFIREGARNNG
ncbi:VOC family protein [Mesorhizobium carmichaelinearum]|uniref:VOC family protein n=1 Tax=Mesorhizobium carmichaelinearum TaxID=1208188 RepID=UPI0015C6FF89|nr:VOC family protein [Mesorhizobium carmichaelinearum]